MCEVSPVWKELNLPVPVSTPSPEASVVARA